AAADGLEPDVLAARDAGRVHGRRDRDGRAAADPRPLRRPRADAVVARAQRRLLDRRRARPRPPARRWRVLARRGERRRPAPRPGLAAAVLPPPDPRPPRDARARLGQLDPHRDRRPGVVRPPRRVGGQRGGRDPQPGRPARDGRPRPRAGRRGRARPARGRRGAGAPWPSVREPRGVWRSLAPGTASLMPYRLDLAADPADALRAAVREQLDDAVRRLRDDRGGDPAEAVHEARKDLKKARSLLRLARPGLPGDVYRRENGALRATGRSLSGARDADVLVETAADLGERYAGQLPEAQFAALGAGLAAAAAEARENEGDDVAADAVATLDAVAARVGDWPLERCDHDTLVHGATRAYRRGRTALAAVEKTPSVERLHDLRKRVKDLW